MAKTQPTARLAAQQKELSRALEPYVRADVLRIAQQHAKTLNLSLEDYARTRLYRAITDTETLAFAHSIIDPVIVADALAVITKHA